MNEEWKRIERYEDYEISNLGRVKSFKQHPEGKILKPKDNGNGYLSIDLRNNNKLKRFYIHRLVAKTFMPNPENKPEIDHIDTNPSNNRIDNLRWATTKENSNNVLTLGKKSSSMQKYVYYCKELNKSFDSSKEAEEYCRSLDVKVSATRIRECSRGLIKTTGNYHGIELTWERQLKQNSRI